MAFLGETFSRVLAAFGTSAPPDLRAADTPTGDRQHSWLPAAGGAPDLLGPELAQALGQPGQSVTHRGPLELIGQFPRQDRGFSGHAGDSLLKPTPPVNDPAITKAMLSITNADDGTGNQMGDQGFALHVKQGVARFDGPMWGGNWIKIDAVGNVEDGRADELDVGVDNLYYYADGKLCGDSKGRDLTDIPIRLFYLHESAVPPVGSVVFDGLRDQSGLAWGPGGYGGPSGQAGYGKITTGWTWVTGYESSVGRFYFNPCDNTYGTGTDATRTYSALAPAGSGRDPNGHVNDVFGYMHDASGARVAVTPNVYDDKIGTIKFWLNTTNVPKGWTIVTESTEGAGRYLIGYEAGTDYDPPGTEVGSYPITPFAHNYADTQLWLLADHDAWDTVSSDTNISIDSTIVTINETSLAISAENHVYAHTHQQSVGQVVDLVGGAGTPNYAKTGETNSTSITLTGSIDAAVCPGTSESHTHTHTLAGAGHTHEFSVDWANNYGPVQSTSTTHTHALTGHTHSHSSPLHGHSVTDAGHQHTNPRLIHTGRLLHHSQDFRPPGAVLVLIKRVGPDDD